MEKILYVMAASCRIHYDYKQTNTWIAPLESTFPHASNPTLVSTTRREARQFVIDHEMCRAYLSISPYSCELHNTIRITYRYSLKLPLFATAYALNVQREGNRSVAQHRDQICRARACIFVCKLALARHQRVRTKRAISKTAVTDSPVVM